MQFIALDGHRNKGFACIDNTLTTVGEGRKRTSIDSMAEEEIISFEKAFRVLFRIVCIDSIDVGFDNIFAILFVSALLVHSGQNERNPFRVKR